MPDIDPFSHALGEIRSDIKGIHEVMDQRMSIIIARLDQMNGTVKWVQENKKEIEQSIEDSQDWIRCRDMGKWVVAGISAAGALGLTSAGKIFSVIIDVFRA